jgi:hypothetical protein
MRAGILLIFKRLHLQSKMINRKKLGAFIL